MSRTSLAKYCKGQSVPQSSINATLRVEVLGFIIRGRDEYRGHCVTVEGGLVILRRVPGDVRI